MCELALIENGDFRKLLEASLEAHKKAYAPYSNFPVGCAIRIANG